MTIGTNNELNCRFITAKKSAAGFRYFTLDGTTSYLRFAARRAMAAYQGTTDSESPTILPFPFAVSAKGFDPICDPATPPDADLSSPLTPEKLKAVFQP